MNSHPQREALKAGLRSLCRLYRGPDDHFRQSLQNGAFLQPFHALAAWMIFQPPDVLGQIGALFDQYSDINSICSKLEETHVRLFVNTREGITAPLYQSCYEYENAPLMGASAMEMRRRFKSKGLALAEDVNEPPDHLSIQLEYLYYLLDTGWAENKGGLLEEASSFAGDTLLPWLTKLLERLPKDADSRYYVLSTLLLISILRYIAETESQLFE